MKEKKQETRKKSASRRDQILRACAVVCAVLFVVYTVIDPKFSEDETVQILLKSTVSRVFGAAVFLFVLLYLRFSLLRRPPLSCLTAFLPALAVVVNNFPILSVANGDAYLRRPELVPLFAVDALMIGVFEEVAFRGVLFPVLLENRRGTTGQIFRTTVIVSAVFGLVHLVNLIEGAGVGPTLLQVGYSFLIGGMCSIVLLKSGNLLLCILLHAVYDFCGGLYPSLGAGVWWDTPTVIFTALLGTVVFVWMMYLLLHIRPEEADRLYGNTRRHPEAGKEAVQDNPKSVEKTKSL